MVGVEKSFINNIHNVINILENLGIPILLQAFGNVYIKISSDPLEGISKLDCLQIVSLNQKLTINFIPSLLQSMQWSQFDSE